MTKEQQLQYIDDQLDKCEADLNQARQALAMSEGGSSFQPQSIEVLEARQAKLQADRRELLNGHRYRSTRF